MNKERYDQLREKLESASEDANRYYDDPGIILYYLKELKQVADEILYSHAKIWIDFDDVDYRGWVRLDSASTFFDLDEFGIELREGLVLNFYNEQKVVQGVVQEGEHFDRWLVSLIG
jgi:hypothetical protein